MTTATVALEAHARVRPRYGTSTTFGLAVLASVPGMFLFWAVFGVTYPASPADFVPGVTFPLGAGVSLIAGMASLIHTRRGNLGVRAGERRTIQVVAAIIGLAIVVSAVLFVVGRSTETVVAPAAEIRMANFEFRPGTFDVPAGHSQILVENADSFVHTFTVPELGIDRTVLPGSRARIEIDAPAGSYTVYCTPHADVDEPDAKDAGMAATLRVR